MHEIALHTNKYGICHYFSIENLCVTVHFLIFYANIDENMIFTNENFKIVIILKFKKSPDNKQIIIWKNVKKFNVKKKKAYEDFLLFVLIV